MLAAVLLVGCGVWLGSYDRRLPFGLVNAERLRGANATTFQILMKSVSDHDREILLACFGEIAQSMISLDLQLEGVADAD